MAEETTAEKAEQRIIGAALLNNSNFFQIDGLIDSSMFSNELYGKIWQSIINLSARTSNVTDTLVADDVESSDSDNIKPILGAMIHAAKKEGDCPVVEYAGIIRNGWQLKSVENIADKVKARISKGGVDSTQLANWAEEQLSIISRSTASRDEYTLAQSLDRVMDDMQDTNRVLIEPCLQILKDSIGTFFGGDLILLGGGSGAFKTALAMQQMIYTGETTPNGFFSLEMPDKALVMRQISQDTGIPIPVLRRGLNAGGVTSNQFEAIAGLTKRYGANNVTIISPPSMSMPQIQSRARALKREGKLNMMVVDHVLLVEGDERQGRPDQAYKAVRQLKVLAKELDIPIIALCQFKVSALTSDEPTPTMQSFYGGGMQQHADLMIGLLNRHQWFKEHPPTSNGDVANDEWQDNMARSNGKIEMHFVKDRSGEGARKIIVDIDAAKFLFKDQVRTGMNLGGNIDPQTGEIRD